MYEGEFINGEFHGKGVWHFLDGVNLEGFWEEGKKNGKFNKIYPNGKSVVMIYKDDIQINEEQEEKEINIE